jgi:hypothetical protein
MDRLDGDENGVDASGVPRWRPRRLGEILQRERRGESVVIPAEQPRQERLPIERRVDPELVPQPLRGVIEGGDLHEGGPPAAEVDDEPPVGRGAVPGRGTPGDRGRAEGTANALDVIGVGMHHRRVMASDRGARRLAQRQAIDSIAEMTVPR